MCTMNSITNTNTSTTSTTITAMTDPRATNRIGIPIAMVASNIRMSS